MEEEHHQRAEKERLEWEAQLEAQRLKDDAEKTAKLQELDRKKEEVKQERLRRTRRRKARRK